ncbi:MAG: hypothetical protein MP439_02550 [Ferrimicrobium sp.]|nr:hypothetical protein [Ferrimicrobium sp.]
MFTEKHADFVLQVKENQPGLYNAISTLEETAFSQHYSETNKGHGRYETRSIQVSSALDGLLSFRYVAQAIRIERTVDNPKAGDELSTESAYYVTSLQETRASKAKLLGFIRQHRGIENALH